MPKSKGRGQDKTGRSEGEQRHLRLEHWILDTAAARSLSGSAFKVLVYLGKRYDGFNNGKIGFGCRSGCISKKTGTSERVTLPIGIGKSAIAAALLELETAGFIRCAKESTFDQKRMAREWRLTWLPVGNEPATKEFATAPARTKKQNAVRQNGQKPPLQSAVADNGAPQISKNAPYSPAERTMGQSDSPPHRTHLITMGSGGDTSEGENACLPATLPSKPNLASSSVRLAVANDAEPVPQAALEARAALVERFGPSRSRMANFASGTRTREAALGAAMTEVR